jgi:hypothetical protein
MFYTIQLSMPLQDVEYVSYRIITKGKAIDWPLERPRIPGRWQQILRGIDGVHMSVRPKVDAVMEVIKDDGTGQLGYVEAVYPDESIEVTSFGRSEEGYYTEETLTKEQWREMRPVFIEIN